MKVDFPSQGSFPLLVSEGYVKYTAWFWVLYYVDKSHTSAFFFMFFGLLTFS